MCIVEDDGHWKRELVVIWQAHPAAFSDPAVDASAAARSDLRMAVMTSDVAALEVAIQAAMAAGMDQEATTGKKKLTALRAEAWKTGCRYLFDLDDSDGIDYLKQHLNTFVDAVVNADASSCAKTTLGDTFLRDAVASLRTGATPTEGTGPTP